MVGASSGPPDSMTRTCAPEAANSAARTEPAAPAPTTMKSYGFIVVDRKSTRLNSSHQIISYAVFCLKKKRTKQPTQLTKSHSNNQCVSRLLVACVHR